MPELFAVFEKGEDRRDGSLFITGVISDSSVDCANEKLNYFGSKPHFQAWSDRLRVRTQGKSSGNIRAAHDASKPCGVVESLSFDDSREQIRCSAHIVEREAVRMIRTGIYSGLSVGGRYLERRPQLDEFGEAVKNARGIVYEFTCEPYEVSLVDAPCCPTAVFEIQKCNGVVEVCRSVRGGKEVEEMTHCPGCSERAKKAHEYVRKASELHDEMLKCASAGHVIPGSQHGQTNHFEAAAKAWSYGSRSEQEVERSGGLLR
jgi:hypothetical protein